MENINIAELLKDYPKGMELYSPIFGEVYFEGVKNTGRATLIEVATSCNSIYQFYPDGKYNTHYSDSECLLFPSKDQRDWSKFQRPYKEEIMKEKLEQITLDIPKGYEFFGINDDNQVVLAKKQPQYPTTYEECCEVIGYESDRQSVTGYLADLIENFQQLIICRNAYWKIGGEEMGLGKPWEPDWKNYDVRKYCIATDKNIVGKYNRTTGNKVLAFPTEEMRDAFYENFKELINETKELL